MLVRNYNVEHTEHTDGGAALKDAAFTLESLAIKLQTLTEGSKEWYNVLANIMDVAEALDYVSERKISKARLALTKKEGHYTEFRHTQKKEP
jgi:hypothetical protein